MLNFTKKEQGILLFLIFGFIFGLFIRTYQIHWSKLPENKGSLVFSNNGGEPFETDVIIDHKISETENHRICVNNANQDELERLPGIGPVIAKRIISYRDKYGAYHSVDELLQIKGIGEKSLNRVKPYICVE